MRHFLSVVCAVALLMVFGVARPALAETYTTSNGVTVRELPVASSGAPTRAHEVTWQVETLTSMTVDHSATYSTVEIDDQAFYEYFYYYDSNNERQVDRITLTYNGVTKSMTGDGYYTKPGPCYQTEEGGYCEEGEMRLTPEAVAFLDFMSSTMLSLHSQQFYDAVEYASDEMSSQSVIGCGASAIGYVASFGAFIKCPTVIGCVTAIALHKIAQIGFICSCFVACV